MVTGGHSYLKKGGFVARKHRKWPNALALFNQQQAFESFKQAATTTQDNQQDKPNLLSSLIDTFSLYNCEPTPQAYHFLFKTLSATSQIHQIPSILHHLQHSVSFPIPESIFIYLIHVYAKSNQVQDSVDLFFNMPNFRCVPSVDSLNALLSVLCRTREGIKLVPQVVLKSRELNIRLESSSFFILIDALCRRKKVGFAVKMFNFMLSEDLVVEGNVCSLLLRSICEDGSGYSVEYVMGFLEQLRGLGFCPGVRDYRNLIRLLVRRGKVVDALGLLNQMKAEGVTLDVVCYNVVLDGFVTKGDFTKVDCLFDELLVLGLVPDVFTYNVYIRGLCKRGNVEEGIEMVPRMRELECKPNVVTYNILVEHLCMAGYLDRAKGLAMEMRSNGIGLNLQNYEFLVRGLSGRGEYVEACDLMIEFLDKGTSDWSKSFDNVICFLRGEDFISKALSLVEKMADRNISPAARVWEALLLNSASGIKFSESSSLDFLNSNET